MANQVSIQKVVWGITTTYRVYFKNNNNRWQRATKAEFDSIKDAEKYVNLMHSSAELSYIL